MRFLFYFLFARTKIRPAFGAGEAAVHDGLKFQTEKEPRLRLPMNSIQKIFELF